MKKINRAIVFPAWGAEWVDRVSSCIRESQLPEYPLFVVTDATTNVDRLPREVVVVRRDCQLSGKARKTEFFNCLPDEIETALFLDADTRVIGDISFGFEKAEQHGIAIVVFDLTLALAQKYRDRVWSDQTYLSLAMELKGFNPHTLSPSFNYRGFGELISGSIRVWHSYEPLPANAASLEKGYLHRYEKGKLVKAVKVPL